MTGSRGLGRRGLGLGERRVWIAKSPPLYTMEDGHWECRWRMRLDRFQVKVNLSPNLNIRQSAVRSILLLLKISTQCFQFGDKFLSRLINLKNHSVNRNDVVLVEMATRYKCLIIIIILASSFSSSQLGVFPPSRQVQRSYLSIGHVTP